MPRNPYSRSWLREERGGGGQGKKEREGNRKKKGEGQLCEKPSPAARSVEKGEKEKKRGGRKKGGQKKSQPMSFFLRSRRQRNTQRKKN